MPISVNDIFKKFDLTISGQVKWGQMVNIDKCGVYVIALTDHPDKMNTLELPVFSDVAIQNWMKLLNQHGTSILIDDEVASVDMLKRRLSGYWLPDETIIYIGKVGPTQGRTFKKRLKEFYDTKLGCDKPHAGGHWINTLDNPQGLTIFYCICDPLLEEQMIDFFCQQVSYKTKAQLHDNVNCFPFANKEKNKSTRKKHKISNQTIDCGSDWKK
jgi:hypothetical protein